MAMKNNYVLILFVATFMFINDSRAQFENSWIKRVNDGFLIYGVIEGKNAHKIIITKYNNELQKKQEYSHVLNKNTSLSYVVFNTQINGGYSFSIGYRTGAVIHLTNDLIEISFAEYSKDDLKSYYELARQKDDDNYCPENSSSNLDDSPKEFGVFF